VKYKKTLQTPESRL